MTLQITLFKKKHHLKKRKQLLEPSKLPLHLLFLCSAFEKLMYCATNGKLFSGNSREGKEIRAVKQLVQGHTASHVSLRHGDLWPISLPSCQFLASFLFIMTLPHRDVAYHDIRLWKCQSPHRRISKRGERSLKPRLMEQAPVSPQPSRPWASSSSLGLTGLPASVVPRVIRHAERVLF